MSGKPDIGLEKVESEACICHKKPNSAGLLFIRKTWFIVVLLDKVIILILHT